MAARDGAKLTAEIRHNLTRPTAWEAVMRVRCSKGLRISSFHGHFFNRSTDLLALPTCDPDKVRTGALGRGWGSRRRRMERVAPSSKGSGPQSASVQGPASSQALHRKMCAPQQRPCCGVWLCLRRLRGRG